MAPSAGAATANPRHTAGVNPAPVNASSRRRRHDANGCPSTSPFSGCGSSGRERPHRRVARRRATHPHDVAGAELELGRLVAGELHAERLAAAELELDPHLEAEV